MITSQDEIPIKLEQQHIDYADEIAYKRRQLGEQKRQPRNGVALTGDEPLRYDTMGARCECAAYLYFKPLKAKWHAFTGGHITDESGEKLPDLDDYIDAKGRAKDWHSLPVQKDAPKHWAYLLVSAEHHPVYLIRGWVWGFEVQNDSHWADPAGGMPAFFVEPYAAIMKPPQLLFDDLRRRKVNREAMTRIRQSVLADERYLNTH